MLSSLNKSVWPFHFTEKLKFNRVSYFLILQTFQYKTPYECIAEGTKQELRQTPDAVEQLKSLLKNAQSPVAEEVLKDIGVSLGKCFWFWFHLIKS